MTTLKDKIRDEIIEYENYTRNGMASDPEVLAETVMNVLKDYITNELFSD